MFTCRTPDFPRVQESPTLKDGGPVLTERCGICLKTNRLVVRWVIYLVIHIIPLVMTLRVKVVLGLLTIPYNALFLSKCLPLVSYFPYILRLRCFENLNCFDVKKSKFIFWIIYSTICKLNVCKRDRAWQVCIFIAPKKESTKIGNSLKECNVIYDF